MLAASGHAVRQIKLPKRVTAFFYIIISIIISLFCNKDIIIL